jgi:hypothetical protein
MDTLAPDGTKGGWTLFLSYYSHDQGGESNHNMHTARNANDPYEFYPGKDGNDFDLKSRDSKDNNFKLPVPKLTGGKDTFIALTGATSNFGITDDSNAHQNNHCFPKVIKWTNRDRLNNWVQFNNVKTRQFGWGLKCSATNKKFVHESWNFGHNTNKEYGQLTNSWECKVLLVWVCARARVWLSTTKCLAFILLEEATYICHQPSPAKCT